MRSAALGVALLVAVVSGCSAEAEPAEVGPLASASVSTDATSTTGASDGPVPVESSLPAATLTATPIPPLEAQRATASGAAAFARHYLALVGDAFARADSTAVRTVTAAGCEGCEALISVIDSLAADGRRRLGGRYVVVEAVAPEVANGDVIVLISYERTPSQIVDASGAPVETSPATPVTQAQMRLVRRSDKWLVQGYRVV